MEQSCESTESGTATSRITLASPETGRGGYITRSKLSLQVMMSIVMIMMMVMIMDFRCIMLVKMSPQVKLMVMMWGRKMIMTEGDDDWNFTSNPGNLYLNFILCGVEKRAMYGRKERKDGFPNNCIYPEGSVYGGRCPFCNLFSSPVHTFDFLKVLLLYCPK